MAEKNILQTLMSLERAKREKDIVRIIDSHKYNYWLEVCALLFLVCLLVRSIIDKKFVSKVNVIFGAAIVCGVIDVTLDVVTAVLLDHPDVVSERFSFFLNGTFYFFQLTFPCLLYSFLIHIAAISEKTRKKMFLFFIPSGLYFWRYLQIHLQSGYSMLIIQIQNY